MCESHAVYHELFAALRPRVSFQTLREILLAAHGQKVARLCLSEMEIPWMVAELEKNGLRVGLHPRKLILSPDQGKGGWVSGYGTEVSLESPLPGYIQLYTGRDPTRVLEAQKAEHACRFGAFGRLLAYPPCCIAFYEASLPVAEQEQGDFLLTLLDASLKGRSEQLPVFPAWTNVGAQYFGYGLISFYPCSFFCAEAATAAREAWRLLRMYDRELADQALAAARLPLLYTEYEGVYAFHEAELEGNTLVYDNSSIECSLRGILADVLSAGDRILIHSARSVEVFCRDTLLARLNSRKLGMMLFDRG